MEYKGVRTELLDIIKRVIKWDEKLEIYTNGVDNAYPERVDRLINNSVTSKMALSILTQYLIGKGFGASDDIIINSDTKQKLYDLALDIDDSLAEFRGVAIHFSYNLNYKPVNPKVIPFENVRIGKKDSKKYNGKILVSDEWAEPKVDNIKIVDVFNNKESVVISQIKQAGDIQKYKGQILYINYDKNYYYPLSRIDSVMNDCDSEAQASVYKNQLLRKGFFGKTLVVTRPLTDNTIPEYLINGSGERIPNREYRNMLDEADTTKKTIETFLGAENAGGAMLMEMDWAGDNLDDAIKIQQIESKLDDKMFSYTEESVSKNILMSFENLPIALVKSPDSAMFGNSGEALKEAKNTYWENTTKERNKFVTILNEVLGYIGLDNNLEVIPLLSDGLASSEGEEKEISPETLKAQASLRGSVGGVQGILGIQQSFADGLTDLESAITILVEIYGFTRSISSALLGRPDENI
jgi:hypothetical protein